MLLFLLVLKNIYNQYQVSVCILTSPFFTCAWYLQRVHFSFFIIISIQHDLPQIQML